MRRVAITRRAPIRRGRKTKYAQRVRNTAHMMAVKQLPCAARELLPYVDNCDSVIEADHVGRRGIGQKCADTETIPLCRFHHRCRHGFAGIFRPFDQADMRAFLATALEWTLGRLGLAS